MGVLSNAWTATRQGLRGAAGAAEQGIRGAVNPKGMNAFPALTSLGAGVAAGGLGGYALGKRREPTLWERATSKMGSDVSKSAGPLPLPSKVMAHLLAGGVGAGIGGAAGYAAQDPKLLDPVLNPHLRRNNALTGAVLGGGLGALSPSLVNGLRSGVETVLPQMNGKLLAAAGRVMRPEVLSRTASAEKDAFAGLLAGALAGPAARGVLGRAAPGIAGKLSGGLRGAAFDLGAGQAAESAVGHLSPKVAFDFLIPSIAGSVLGGGLGAHAGELLGQNIGHLGIPTNIADKLQTPLKLLGTAVGSSVGKSFGDRMDTRRQTLQQASMDPTTEDIPPWAMNGAAAFRDNVGLRMASHDEGVRDLLLGELPGYSAVRGYQMGGIPGALKGVAGQVIPAVLAGGLTHMAGKGLSHLTGFDPKLPFTNMPLRDVATGTAASIAGTLGMQRLLGR